MQRRAPRRLGVIGTFVWDVHPRPRSHRKRLSKNGGGITYALGALDTALADDWEIVPIIKVGSDLAPRAHEFIRTLRRMTPDSAPIEVPHPNNRVTIPLL